MKCLLLLAAGLASLPACHKAPPQEAQPPAPRPQRVQAPPPPEPTPLPDRHDHAEKPATRPLDPHDPSNDPEKPFLTDDKMGRLLESLKEDMCPLYILFRETGEARPIEEMEEKTEEFDAFARRYGFADHEEYMHAWARVEGIRIGRETAANAVHLLEEMLARPDLTPEERKAGEEQLLKARWIGFNESDVTLVEKYKAPYAEALKKRRRQP